MSQIELKIDGVVVYSTTAVIPPIEPPPIFVPPVPTTPPPSGWSVFPNPATSHQISSSAPAGIPLDIAAGRTFVFTSGANIIHAFAINFDDARFAGYTAASLGFAETSFNRTQREVSISNAPGDMNALPGGRLNGFQEAAVIWVSLNEAIPGACHLNRNQTYWLNVKATTAGVINTYLLQPFPQ